MLDPRRKIVDFRSITHAQHHFRGQLVKKFLRALRQTKRKLTELDHQLECLIGNGDPGDGKLAAWTNYQPSPNHPNFVPDLPSPGEILDRDLNFVHACLDIVKKRTYAEYNPTPSASPTAEKRQIVTDDSLLQLLHPQLQPVEDNNPMLPPHPQPLPSVQPQSHETTTVAGKSEHKQNETKLPPTAVRDKMRSIETDRKALESQDQPQNI